MTSDGKVLIPIFMKIT